MKKIFLLSAFCVAMASLSACGSIPTCNDGLNECDRGSAYTEERTVGIKPRVVMVEPEPMPEPEPVVVVEPEPMPEPEPIQDVQVMRSAEPQFKQISK